MKNGSNVSDDVELVQNEAERIENDIDESNNAGMGVARVGIDQDNMQQKREKNDKEKGTDSEARELIQRYEVQLVSGKTGIEYDEWRRDNDNEQNPLFPDPWKEGEDNY